MISAGTLRRIVNLATRSELSEWWAYRCENAMQSLSRLALHFQGHEVQINLIDHSREPHCHACDMASVILDRGYSWWLQQYGAKKPVFLHAAPLSIVTMEPSDTHWIPGARSPSLSLCVFANNTKWHEHYPSLKLSLARSIHERAVEILKSGRSPILSAIDALGKTQGGAA